MGWWVDIIRYSIGIRGNSNSNFPAGNKRIVYLYPNQGGWRGMIQFIADDQVLPNPQESEYPDGTKRVSAYMHVHNYPDVIDLLRNEKPIRLSFYAPTVWISTGSLEPIGEEET